MKRFILLILACTVIGASCTTVRTGKTRRDKVTKDKQEQVQLFLWLMPLPIKYWRKMQSKLDDMLKKLERPIIYLNWLALFVMAACTAACVVLNNPALQKRLVQGVIASATIWGGSSCLLLFLGFLESLSALVWVVIALAICLGLCLIFWRKGLILKRWHRDGNELTENE